MAAQNHCHVMNLNAKLGAKCFMPTDLFFFGIAHLLRFEKPAASWTFKHSPGDGMHHVVVNWIFDFTDSKINAQHFPC